MDTVNCHPNGVTGFGLADADVLICGIAPGKDEQNRTHRPFTGPSGKLLDATLKATGYSREKCYTTNLLCWWKNDPSQEEIDACFPRLKAEIERVKPKLIITLGKLASEHLTGLNFGKVRGSVLWLNQFNCWGLSTYHPSGVLHKGGNPLISDLVRDLKKIPLVLGWPKDYGKVAWQLVGKSFAQSTLNDLPKDDFVSLDVETNIDTGDLRCLAIASNNGTWVFPRDTLDNLRWPPVQWTFHNGMFDTEVLRKNLNVELPIVEDTMLMSYSLDERGGGTDEGAQDRAVGIHGLKKLSSEYLGAGFYDIDVQGASDVDLYPYNAKDAAYTYRLAKMFSQWQRDDSVRHMYKKLLIKPANILTGVHERGAYVQRFKLESAGLALTQQWLVDETELIELAQGYGWDGPINVNSPIQVKKLLFDHIGLPETEYGRSTQQKALEQIDHPFTDKLLKWRGLDRMLSTYVIGLGNTLDKYGYCHPSPLLHGTRTGRWSYRTPPVQTIPSDYKASAELIHIRELFAASSLEREILQADYRHSEIYAAAMCSGDTVMAKDLQHGDFHQLAAEDMFGIKKEDCIPLQWNRYRQDSKFVTFGVLFGRQAAALFKAELSHYTFQECQDFVTRWLERYKIYAQWAKAERESVQKTGEQVNKAGRKRRYHLVLDHRILNQAVNFPVQSLSHDNLVLSLIDLYEPLRALDSYFLFEVHDSLILETSKQHRGEVVNLVRDIMQRDRFGLSVPVEIKIGPSWGEAKVID